MAGQRPTLAVEHVDLGLHQRRALGEADELRVQLEQLGLVAVARHGGELVGRGRPPTLVPRRLGPRLRDEQVDLAQLVVEPRDVVVEAGAEFGEIGRRGDRSVSVGVGSVTASVMVDPGSRGSRGS